jgi:hypothetical protein
MKRIFAALVALFIAALSAFALASPASATGDHGTEIKGKPVDVCHATSSKKNPYVELKGVPVVQFFGQNGHYDHSKDIWAEFTYLKRTGSETWETVTVPAQGDQSILLNGCEAPDERTKVTVSVSQTDKCGTSQDVVTANFAPAGAPVNIQVDKKSATTYEVVVVVNDVDNYILDVDGTWTVTQPGVRAVKTITLTDEDCGLPDTGGEAVYATGIGVAALAAVGLLGLALFSTRRRNAE